MYLFELKDILLIFAVKSIITPTNQFNITNPIKFSSGNTRSGSNNKLIHPYHMHLNNISRHSYFHRLPLLWNAMSVLDLNSPFPVVKYKLKYKIKVQTIRRNLIQYRGIFRVTKGGPQTILLQWH